MIRVPHFSYPFHFHDHGDGIRAHVVEQDSFDEIFGCVEAIARFRKGTRSDLPDFGITDPAFSSPVADADLLRAEISQWEPRAEEVITQEIDRFDSLIHRVRLEIYSREEARSA